MAALTNVPETSDAAAWRTLVDSLQVEDLVTAFLDRVSVLKEYRESGIPRSNLAEAARSTFQVLIPILRDGDHTTLHEVSAMLGTSRARARIPLDSLMTAIGYDYQVLWDALVKAAGENDAALLVRHTALVWQTVDQYAQLTRMAYLAEFKQLSLDEESTRRGLVSELLQVPNLSVARLEFLAQQLFLPPRGSYTVFAVLGGAEPQIRALLHRYRLMDRPWCTAFLGGTLVGLLPDNADTAVLRRELRRLPVGLVEGVPRLGAVPAATELARTLASKPVGESRATTVHDLWPVLTAEILSETYLADFFDAETLTDAFTPADRDTILPTIIAYLRSGSVARVSEQMYCHRNTVTNRLNRFHELTGYDVSVPRDAAKVLLMLAVTDPYSAVLLHNPM